MTTIALERSLLAAKGPADRLIRREEWGARFKSYADTDGRKTVEPAHLVFIHITITNPKNYSSDAAHCRAVEAIGISRFPNTGMSYNRLFAQSGKAFEGQPMGRRGAHTVNNFNRTTCTTPGCPSKGGRIPSASTNLNDVVRAYVIMQNVGDTVTDAQLDSMAQAIAGDQLAGLVILLAPTHGHKCVAPKECPAAKMWARMQELENKVVWYVQNGLPGKTSDVGDDDMALSDDDKKYIELNNKKYAIANNNFTRQTVSAATKAIMLEINEIDEETANRVEAQLQDDFKKLSDQIIADAENEVPTP